MKIIHHCNDTDLGGVQILAFQKVKDLLDLGHEAVITTYKIGNYKPKFNIPVIDVKDKSGLAKFVKEFAPDILHGHSCGGGSDVISIGKDFSIKCGESIHSSVPGKALADFEITHTYHVYSLRLGSTLCYVGLDTTRLTPTISREEARKYFNLPQDSLVISRNSRLDGSKKPCDFLYTLYLLPYYYGIIGGWGPEEDKLRSLAKELGILDRVRFTGFTLDIANIFVASDFIVYPTEDESLCLGTIEPMFQYKPVVCYLRGGMSQHIRHGETALVGNTPQELRDHILTLEQDYSLCSYLSHNAFNLCNDFGYWNSMRETKEHIEIYERVL